MRRGFTSIFDFSGREILDLLLSTLVLAAAFSFVLSQSCFVALFSQECTGIQWDTFLWPALPVSTVLVLAAFVLHELAHKLTAQYYGLWAEFRASMSGLLIALGISGALGVVVAAPGAVIIRGPASKKEAGIISVNGPLVNLGFAAIALPLWLLTDQSVAFDIGVPQAGNFFQLALLINVILAAFNMLPIKPLDGSKIIRWNIFAFLGVWVATLGLFYLGFLA